MLATLIVIVIVVILGAVVLATSPGSPPSTQGSGASSSTTTTEPKTIASGTSEATLAACEANYATVELAVATYRALNGSDPPAGTAWATSTVNGGPLIAVWPTGAEYALSWNGSTVSVTPLHGTASHGSFGTSAPKTGCFAT